MGQRGVESRAPLRPMRSQCWREGGCRGKLSCSCRRMCCLTLRGIYRFHVTGSPAARLRMWTVYALAVTGVLVALPGGSEALREGECEVCVSFLERFYQSLVERKVDFKADIVEKELLKICNEAKGKENRLCYYIGATSDAATKITNEVSKPLSTHIPAKKICEKLKKKDSQICELKYDKQIDLTTVDLKKLKVKELKKILDDWGEMCKGCAEKSDYIRKINELMPKYAPHAAKARTDL